MLAVIINTTYFTHKLLQLVTNIAGLSTSLKLPRCTYSMSRLLQESCMIKYPY